MSQARIVTIEANIAWRAKQMEQSERWIGVCDELNLAMEADSLDELHSLIPEALHLLMLDLLLDNELEAFLRDRGWHSSSLPTSDEAVDFDMPWQLITEGRRGSEFRNH